jgi:hypothetical protein
MVNFAARSFTETMRKSPGKIKRGQDFFAFFAVALPLDRREKIAASQKLLSSA